MADIVDRLRDRTGFFSTDGNRWHPSSKPDADCAAAAAEILRLRSELEAAKKDAGRYRWLREQHEGRDSGETFCVFQPDYGAHCLDPVGSMPGELDAAIDAEMAKDSTHAAYMAASNALGQEL